MAVLYLANKQSDLTTCLQGMQPEDHLVLSGDAVYFLVNNVFPENVSTLQSDLHARGLDSYLPKHINNIDYSDLVKLCVSYATIVTWS
jgi:sulfur relay protein TusB/DsrH